MASDPASLGAPAEFDDHIIPPESDTLIGLPPVLFKGLIGVTTIAGISLVSCTALFLHLTYRLVRWHFRVKSPSKQRRRQSSYTDFNLGLAARHFHRKFSRGSTADPESGRPEQEAPHPNQFILLIHNLMLADIHHSLSFFFNAVWLAKDAILVGTGTCYAQGWFMSTGGLAASLCVTNIAIHNYCIIVRGWKPPHWVIVTANIMVWVIDYGLAALGIAVTRNGAAYGGFYVRAGAWCWMNVHYQTLRLAVHYLYIFMALIITSILYILIFVTLQKRRKDGDDTSTHSGSSMRGITSSGDGSVKSRRGGDSASKPDQHVARQLQRIVRKTSRHQIFLLYPIIYVVCTLPLLVARIATMAGYKVHFEFFCIVGALLASNGFLNALLWGITRRSIVFGGDVGASEDLGLEGFSFMLTPANRVFGNMVLVEAGPGIRASHERGFRAWATDEGKKANFWQRQVTKVRRLFGLRCPHKGKEVHLGALDRRESGWNGFMSEESLDRGLRGEGRLAIQLECVTEVKVEINPHNKNRLREPSLRSVQSNPEYEDIDLPPIE